MSALTEQTTPARAALTHRMSEKELQACVVELAGYLGFHVFHPWTAIHSAEGGPDLVLCRPTHRERPGRLVIAELKAERGRLSRAQERWLYDLTSAGVECYLWRPSDWHSGEIERVLAGPVSSPVGVAGYGRKWQPQR